MRTLKKNLRFSVFCMKGCIMYLFGKVIFRHFRSQRTKLSKIYRPNVNGHFLVAQLILHIHEIYFGCSGYNVATTNTVIAHVLELMSKVKKLVFIRINCWIFIALLQNLTIQNYWNSNSKGISFRKYMCGICTVDYYFRWWKHPILSTFISACIYRSAKLILEKPIHSLQKLWYFYQQFCWHFFRKIIKFIQHY